MHRARERLVRLAMTHSVRLRQSYARVGKHALIAYVLDKLVNLWPASRNDELMPWAWAKASAPDRLAA